MRKLYSLLSITLFVLYVATSCSEKDDPIVERGKLTSATYSPTTKKFTLNYSKGPSETVDAIIDNSVNPPTASATLKNGVIISVNDATIEDEASIGSLSAYQYVNDWIYKEMNIYYLWNDLITKKPEFDFNPNKFFDSLLNKYDKITNPEGDRFSWIEESSEDLLGSLGGVKSDDIGFEYIFASVNKAETQYYAFVTYPKLGSDAHANGIDRGRVITKVDGENITGSNYRSLFSGNGSKTLSMADFIPNGDGEGYTLTSTGDVKIQMENNFAETPVYLDSVYSYGDKKIGYLVYNFFATGKNNKTHEYDDLLMSTLAKMKFIKGANEMVLDLRYNGGGTVSTAIALASALVKDRSTDNILVTAKYNSIVDKALKEEPGAGDDYNKDFFIDKIKDGRKEITVPALNLPRLYVLVSRGSASASELIINGLKPYMDVILIGETTYGKNVGSISLYEENDPKNRWGMQPIIVKYYNNNGFSDFTAGFTPDFEVDEFDYLPFVEFGNIEDPLLSTALNEITDGALGDITGVAKTRSLSMPYAFKQLKAIDLKSSSSTSKGKYKFEMYDDVRGDKIKKLLNK